MAEGSHRPRVRIWLALALAAVAAILVGGVVWYDAATRRQLRREAERELSAVANFKTREIQAWLDDQVRDAATLGADPLLQHMLCGVLGTTQPALPAELHTHLAALAASHDYSDLFVVDPRGAVCWSLHGRHGAIGPEALATLQAVLDTGVPALTPLHRCQCGAEMHLSAVMPLFAPGPPPARVVGAWFAIAPAEPFLAAVAQAWPTTRQTAETMLVTRDGKTVRFLLRPRHLPEEAAAVGIPVSRTEVAAVQAVLGRTGFYEGEDYRGVAVLACLAPIPDSPWYLVAKIDAAEVLAPARVRVLLAGLTLGGVAVAALALAGAVWQRTLKRRYRAALAVQTQQAALRRRYELLVQHANDMIVLADEQGHITEANDRAVAAYGYSLADLLGRNLRDLVAPEDLDALEQSLQTLGTKGHYIREGLHRRRDGTRFPVEVSVRVLDVDGRAFMQAIVRDISERRRAEQRFRALFDLPQVGAVITAPDGRWLAVNDRFCEIVGYTRAELDQVTWMDLTPPEELVDEWPRHQRALRGQHPSRAFEKHYIRKDGRRIDVYVSAMCVFTPEGRPDYVVAMVQDITDRKRAETELRIAATAFEAQQGIIITDAQARILRVNRAFTETTGYTAEEAVGQTPRLVKSGQHGPAFYEAMWASIRTTGAWCGEIWNRRKTGEIYPEWLTISAVRDEQGRATHYVGTLTDISARRRMEDILRRQASEDALTGLANRHILTARAQHALDRLRRRATCGVALLFLDLNDFKEINDAAGHAVGDQVLHEVAGRLRQSARPGDTVARFGGDEFGILLEDVCSADAAREVAERIHHALQAVVHVAGRRFVVTASIGVALCAPGTDLTPEEVLQQADMAMYEAKAAGPAQTAVYTDSIRSRMEVRVQLKTDLREALRSGGIAVHFQPLLDLRSGRVVGCEALARWPLADGRQASPAHFIPLAERSGMIGELEGQVIALSLQALAAWQQADALPDDFRLTLNVSPLHLREAHFAARLGQALASHGIAPRNVVIEVTETTLIRDAEAAARVLALLRAQGFGVAIDDFGTGYSSLSHLLGLPITMLKIDQSFIEPVQTTSGDRTLVRALINMAHSLNLLVVAEGIEKRAQLDLLRRMGCDLGQGYLISRPLSAEQFAAGLCDGWPAVRAAATGAGPVEVRP